MRDSWRKRLRRILIAPGGDTFVDPFRRPFAPRVEELEWRVVPAAPIVLSMNRSSPTAQTTSVGSVQYAVTFDQSVTGVDETDFKITTIGTVRATSTTVFA